MFLNRRHVLGAGVMSFHQKACLQQQSATAATTTTTTLAEGQTKVVTNSTSSGCISSISYWNPGPYKFNNFKVEHTCSICFPSCVGDQCILRLHVYYPASAREAVDALAQRAEGGDNTRGICTAGSTTSSSPVSEAITRNTKKPWPLAVFSSGFLVGSDQYRSYAEQLASYGYVSVLYDKMETPTNAINDDLSALFVSEIINWLASVEGVRTEGVYCVGHSRGGKISLLAAENDERIGSVCLIDPVDSNDYAPEGPGYPSAIKNLRTSPLAPKLPVAIIGGGRSTDCIPRKANFERFFEGSRSLTMMISIKEAGHFQFLDKTSMMQAAVCSGGKVEDQAVRDLSKAAMVAWAESTLPYDGGMVDPNPIERMQVSVDSMSKILTQTYGIQEEAIHFEFKNKESM